jgi:hypothetical protein
MVFYDYAKYRRSRRCHRPGATLATLHHRFTGLLGGLPANAFAFLDRLRQPTRKAEDTE